MASSLLKSIKKNKNEILISSDPWCPTKYKLPSPTAQKGLIQKKPWQYNCEAWIPHLDTPDTLPYVIELLRLQTDAPFIVIVDTGSTAENFNKIFDKYKTCEDVEIHSLRFKSVIHSSDFPAIAMDLAMSAVRSKYLFCTHADVFLKRRNFIEELIMLCDEFRPAVGYQMTPRDHDDWERMVSHTATMLHVPTMDKINAAWSLRKLCNRKGLDFIPNHPQMGNNWPDTEILYNYILWENGYSGKFIGTEKNHERTDDKNIDHCRSLTAGRLYATTYAEKAQVWVNDAIRKATERIECWRKEKELDKENE